tara:strand:+ start:1905 stop:2117 length:213 start_codon:yes stop_codon:yes gene_type:complete
VALTGFINLSSILMRKEKGYGIQEVRGSIPPSSIIVGYNFLENIMNELLLTALVVLHLVLICIGSYKNFK